MSTISVLLPVFNAKQFVAQAVSSILRQTFGDFELLIIDDGSSDGSEAVLRSLAASDARIRLTRRENKGLVLTLNEMLGMASSPFVARMDADDVAEPTRFERQLREFERDSTLLAVGSDVYSIDSKGRRLMTIRMPRTHEAIDAHNMEVVNGAGMCHPSMMFRSAAFELAGGYRKEYWPAEDADLILRICEKGRVANIPVPLLSYRVHSDSIGHMHASRQRAALYRAACAAAARRGTAPPETGLAELHAHKKAQIESPVARDIKWAWWALKGGNLRTARSLAFSAVVRAPFERAAWVVLGCAIRGR